MSLATLRAQFQDIVDNGHQVLALINSCYGVDFHRLSLALQALDLETHVLGLPAAHPSGEETGLMLGELGLEDLQLTLRLVELELELSKLGGFALPLRLHSLQLLVGGLVCGQLGKGLPLLQQTVDLEVDLLEVEQVGEAGQLHVDQAG